MIQAYNAAAIRSLLDQDGVRKPFKEKMLKTYCDRKITYSEKDWKFIYEGLAPQVEAMVEKHRAAAEARQALLHERRQNKYSNKRY
jgi:hypothetical protein